jgi:hypothetical protein
MCLVNKSGEWKRRSRLEWLHFIRRELWSRFSKQKKRNGDKRDSDPSAGNPTIQMELIISALLGNPVIFAVMHYTHEV